MGARYVFFRDPTGKAYRGTDGKHAPRNLLADVGKTSFLEGGQVGWKGWPMGQEGLYSSFVVLDADDVELNDHDARQIARTAVAELAKRSPGRPINPQEVLAAADRHAAAFFRKEPVGYVLVTSLSVPAFPARRIDVRGSTITPLRRRGRYVLPQVLRSRGHRNTFAEHLESTQYRLVKVATRGRTVFEAVGKALDDLSILRALWSFGATRGRWTMRLGGGRRRPIGVIHTGPVHTLHRPDGTPVDEELYWFDPDYTRDLDLFRRPQLWPQMEAERRCGLRLIARLPYRRELEDVLIRYAAALDQSNPNVAFLQLWAILEKVTNTVGAKYEETIRRACWVYARTSRPLAEEMLESLRHHRNRYVHSGNSGPESEEVAYRIKAFVDPHLVRLLTNAYRVCNFQEYGDFLALPTDVRKLERMRSWSARALHQLREDESEPETASAAG